MHLSINGESQTSAVSLHLLYHIAERIERLLICMGINVFSLFSSALVCPPNSHYSMCVSSCPETCLGINGPPGCSEKCVEGCECNPGFILSDDKCVPLKDCGCVDSSGSYHPVSLKHISFCFIYFQEICLSISLTGQISHLCLSYLII